MEQNVQTTAHAHSQSRPPEGAGPAKKWGQSTVMEPEQTTRGEMTDQHNVGRKAHATGAEHWRDRARPDGAQALGQTRPRHRRRPPDGDGRGEPKQTEQTTREGQTPRGGGRILKELGVRV